jgi:hypothetical protein
VTLAAFLEANTLERVHFIKFNVEGAEFPILLSTPGSVLQRFDMMVVLYHCDLCPDRTAADLLRHLESSGFACAVRYTHRAEKRGWIVATNQSPRVP